jgi:hypothetical protein
MQASFGCVMMQDVSVLMSWIHLHYTRTVPLTGRLLINGAGEECSYRSASEACLVLERQLPLPCPAEMLS